MISSLPLRFEKVDEGGGKCCAVIPSPSCALAPELPCASICLDLEATELSSFLHFPCIFLPFFLLSSPFSFLPFISLPFFFFPTPFRGHFLPSQPPFFEQTLLSINQRRVGTHLKDAPEAQRLSQLSLGSPGAHCPWS